MDGFSPSPYRPPPQRRNHALTAHPPRKHGTPMNHPLKKARCVDGPSAKKTRVCGLAVSLEDTMCGWFVRTCFGADTARKQPKKHRGTASDAVTSSCTHRHRRHRKINNLHSQDDGRLKYRHVRPAPRSIPPPEFILSAKELSRKHRITAGDAATCSCPH